jgi:hypothetical protein
VLARALVVIASAVIAAALVIAYAERAIIDGDQFANRATVALHDDSVRTLLSQRITDDLILKQEGDLLAARPLIQSVVSGILGSRAFTKLFRAGVLDLHRAVFDRDQDTVTLTVADVGTVAGAALEKLKPDIARKLAITGRVELVKRDLGKLGASLARIPAQVKLLAVVLLLGSVLFVTLALVVSPDNRLTMIELGIGTAVCGVLVAVGLGVARSVAIHHVEGADAKAAAGAVWGAFFTDLRTAGWILAGTGAVIAAAADSLIKPFDVREPIRVAAAWLTREPRRRPVRIARAVVLTGAGILVLVARDAVVALLLTLAGVYLVYEGASALLRVVYRPRRRRAPEPEPEIPPPRERHPRLVTAIVAAGLVAAAVVTFLGSGGVTTAAPPPGPCEGHAELCDRPLAQIALPATHNSMSVPLPGWYSAEQDKPIADQLRAGVRGFLIDTHYADRLPNGKFRTDDGSLEKFQTMAEQDGVSPAAVDAALRIRDRLGFRGQGKRGMYLCHSFCELGATALEPVLRDIHDFLVANPNQVIVVVNQDYVTPGDFVSAANDAGLGQLAYSGPITKTRPTLREMIDTGKRVVFLAENHAGAAPWYRPAYDGITEETPYTFPKVADLNDPAKVPASCRPNRGTSGAPLFLLNHWISTDPLPKPSDALKVNAYGPLLARVRECQRLRHHVVNLVAVNFYDRGDVFKVVDTLNGVP